ncbi:MAG: L,D-transpeptidase [Streptococcaceae bacterium]|nr:L,D-transpeptidase [Streptococcaceae bacterium]
MKKNATFIKRLLITFAFLFGLVSISGIGYQFFRMSHFAYGETIEGQNISLLNLDDAYDKLAKINKERKVTILNAGKTYTIQTPPRFDLSKEILQKCLSSGKMKLPTNPHFQSVLTSRVKKLPFSEEKGKNAYLKFVQDEAFTIVPEVKSTVVDREKLEKSIESNWSTQTFYAKDFYIPVSVSEKDPTLLAELKKANAEVDKEITLKINGQTMVIPKNTLAKFIDAKGEIIDKLVYNWVAGPLNDKYSTLKQSVHWTNPKTKKTYEYKNNGAYGWDINYPDGQKQIVNAMKSEKKNIELTLKIDGNKEANPRDVKDFVYIDLHKQMEYIYHDNKQVLSTRIISGRNNKGTATTPGFLTIGYKDRNAHLKGQGLDGKKYDVPVSYWEPLLSRGTNGPYYTGIGMHDSNNKELGFQDIDAWKTLLGSNGCINHPPHIMPKVWENTFQGMAVIIRGDIYQDSPGSYDKPVDFGKEITE